MEMGLFLDGMFRTFIVVERDLCVLYGLVSWEGSIYTGATGSDVC
jgi:hypothetical protein